MTDSTQQLEWSTDDGSPNVPVGLYLESQFTGPQPWCPHPERYTTNDAQATENEVQDFAWGLVRALQPDVCIETGTSRGFLAERLGEALHQNGQGHLFTYEPHEPTWREAADRITAAKLGRYVTCRNEASMTEWEGGQIDFAWFDSLLNLRWTEFDYYHQFMHDRTVVCFHDTAPKFGNWARRVWSDRRLDVIELPTPRGVIVARCHS